MSQRDFMATPDHGPGPGVLVLHSKRGLTTEVRYLCRLLAREGFVALAVDLFDGVTPQSQADFEKVRKKVDESPAVRSVENQLSFLQKYEQVIKNQIAILGLGYGATIGFKVSGSNPSDIAGLIAFYGIRENDIFPTNVPIQGHFSTLDRTIPPSRVASFEQRLKAEGCPIEFYIYDGTDPYFFEDDLATTDFSEATQLAWNRTCGFLEEHVTSSPE